MGETVMYKGRPLVRNGNKIYYGDPKDKYILVLTILENKDNVPTRINIQIWDTNPDLALKSEKIVKQGEKKDLSEAMDFGIVWLERELAK